MKKEVVVLNCGSSSVKFAIIDANISNIDVNTTINANIDVNNANNTINGADNGINSGNIAVNHAIFDGILSSNKYLFRIKLF